jgi:glycosyltransferase involved in cell wall biosynthesis
LPASQPVKLRIAHILPWSGIGGGVEQGTLRLTRSPFQPPIEHVAYCLPDATRLRQEFADAGCQVASYEVPFPRLRWPFPYLQASRRLARDFEEKYIDVVHCSDVLGAYSAGLAAKLARKPLVCHVRCNFDSLPRIERALLGLVDHFLFVSQETWNRFAYRVAPARGTVLYDSLEPPALVPEDQASVRQEFGIPEGCACIGMVARVAPAKDYETLIDAAAQITAAQPQVRFLIVGDNASTPEYRSHYQHVKALLHARNMEPFFIFTGYRSDVPRLMRAMDLVILSTRSEGAPLVILEAMALRKPVLATAVGGVPELIQHNNTGMLHRLGDAAELSSQVIALLEDPAWAAAIGAAGLEQVKQRFGPLHYSQTMQHFYRHLKG